MIGANEETSVHASDSTPYLAVGAPVIMLSFIHSNLLHFNGMSKKFMVGTISGAVINIILAPIFVSALGMGTKGIAIAMEIRYLFTDIFFTVIVARKSKILSVNPREIKISTEHMGQILGIDIPVSITNPMQSVSAVLVNQLLLPFGNDKIATMGIVLKVNMITLLLLIGFAFGKQPLFRYYYGSGDKERLRELLHFCLRRISTIAAILTATVFLSAPVL